MDEVVENSEFPGAAEASAQVDPAVQARVKAWCQKIRSAKEHYEKKAFKRMRACMQLAKDGADEQWIRDDKYVVPIINRHINQSVSQLYAKNPKAYARRKQRRMFTVWDGKLASLQEAIMTLQSGMMDPNAMAVLQDAMMVKQYNAMMDGLAETLTLLHNHYMGDKAAQYKQQFKALVRRTKVCCVGYVKLGFQRILEPDPDITVKLKDVTEQVSRIERLMAENARDEFQDDSEKLDELRTMMADLQAQETLVVQEGPVLSFPRATSIIIDPDCQHLKTLAGANWIAEEIDMTPARIEEVYKVDVRKGYERYQPTGDTQHARVWAQNPEDKKGEEPAKVWIVQDRATGQEFTLCDGYADWLRPPAPPEVQITRFFTIFPLVFNEIEDEDDLFPPSDVWSARHIQKEYNRKRNGLRAHRIGNRPAYIAAKGAFETNDLNKLQAHEDNEIIELNQLSPTDKVADKIQAKPSVPIDPNLYEVESDFADIQRVVGTQQANLGPTSGNTATETSIAEQSRTVSLADNIDDLDDLLTLLAHSTGELMLREVSRETVVRIVGPGAVWPEDVETRQEIVEDITLEIQAGSSGRPNQAAELAKMERAMPIMLQLPNVNPIPPTQKYLDLLDIDAEDAIIEGLPSISALNAMMGHSAGMAPTGGPPQDDPAAQGPQGANNTPAPAANEPQSQPAYPTPAVVPS